MSAAPGQLWLLAQGTLVVSPNLAVAPALPPALALALSLSFGRGAAFRAALALELRLRLNLTPTRQTKRIGSTRRLTLVTASRCTA